ncbi:hypothetical protein EX30DRAFT_350372 [Ascodesmis nigricans]|uniref:Uncharacterized protein n=1 Tax=Ascodesmis nigricans TaxID=341454 RepID=A0A4S2MQ02_9PEZI|nr:hypothetical protein EX30DRAFT_350372 [Ascodesmis nigricans]
MAEVEVNSPVLTMLLSLPGSLSGTPTRFPHKLLPLAIPRTFQTRSGADPTECGWVGVLNWTTGCERVVSEVNAIMQSGYSGGPLINSRLEEVGLVTYTIGRSGHDSRVWFLEHMEPEGLDLTPRALHPATPPMHPAASGKIGVRTSSIFEFHDYNHLARPLYNLQQQGTGPNAGS